MAILGNRAIWVILAISPKRAILVIWASHLRTRTGLPKKKCHLRSCLNQRDLARSHFKNTQLPANSAFKFIYLPGVLSGKPPCAWRVLEGRNGALASEPTSNQPQRTTRQKRTKRPATSPKRSARGRTVPDRLENCLSQNATKRHKTPQLGDFPTPLIALDYA